MHQCSALLRQVALTKSFVFQQFSVSITIFFPVLSFLLSVTLPQPRSKTCFYPMFLWTTAASKYILQNKRVLNNSWCLCNMKQQVCVCVLWEWPHCDVMWSDVVWVELVCGFWSMIGSLCGLAMPPCIKRKPLTHTHAYFFIADYINRSPWLLSFLWVSTCVCVCPCRCLNHQK